MQRATPRHASPLVLNGLAKRTVVKDERAFAGMTAAAAAGPSSSAAADRGTAMGSDLRVQFCQDCFIYVLAPVR